MKRLCLLTAMMVVALSAEAFGQSAARDGYGGVTVVTHKSGSLPFTGFDVLLLALGGLALVGVGIVVRRLSRTPA